MYVPHIVTLTYSTFFHLFITHYCESVGNLFGIVEAVCKHFYSESCIEFK